MTPEEIRERFRYHAPNPAQRETFERIRERMLVAVEGIAVDIPHSRERSEFISLMQTAQMKANAAVAIHGGGDSRPAYEPDPLDETLAACGDPERIGATPGRSYALPPIQGRVHLATTGRPDYRREFSWPPGEPAAEVAVTVIPGEIDPRGAQLLWWCMPRHRNLLALALVRGEGRRRQLVFRTDVGVDHGKKQREVREVGVRFRERRAYRAVARYEPGGAAWFQLADLESGETLVSIDVTANAGRWPRHPMVLGLGYPRFDAPDVQAHHPIQPGWEWRGLEIAAAR